MKMLKLSALSALAPVLLFITLFSSAAHAQSKAAVLGTGSLTQIPIQVAPGGIITVFTAGLSPSTASAANADRGPLPTTLAGITASIRQTYPPFGPLSVPLVSVFSVPTCFNQVAMFPSCTSALTGIRLQIPFEVAAPSGLEAPPNFARLTLNDQSGNSASIDISPFLDQVHLLTPADTKLGTGSGAFVTHADGSPVGNTNPANAGEELVVYGVGLGPTSPKVPTGQVTPSAANAITLFVINYDYTPNAAPSRGLIPGSLFASGKPGAFPAPVYAGLSPGTVGLYQFNFVVPSPPSGTPPCDDVVHSNLTVSFVGPNSFDGAAICVTQ